jgi:hypothetical protein
MTDALFLPHLPGPSRIAAGSVPAFPSLEEVSPDEPLESLVVSLVEEPLDSSEVEPEVVSSLTFELPLLAAGVSEEEESVVSFEPEAATAESLVRTEVASAPEPDPGGLLSAASEPPASVVRAAVAPVVLSVKETLPLSSPACGRGMELTVVDTANTARMANSFESMLG